MNEIINSEGKSCSYITLFLLRSFRFIPSSSSITTANLYRSIILFHSLCSPWNYLWNSALFCISIEIYVYFQITLFILFTLKLRCLFIVFVSINWIYKVDDIKLTDSNCHQLIISLKQNETQRFKYKSLITIWKLRMQYNNRQMFASRRCTKRSPFNRILRCVSQVMLAIVSLIATFFTCPIVFPLSTYASRLRKPRKKKRSSIRLSRWPTSSCRSPLSTDCFDVTFDAMVA